MSSDTVGLPILHLCARTKLIAFTWEVGVVYAFLPYLFTFMVRDYAPKMIKFLEGNCFCTHFTKYTKRHVQRL